MWSPEAQQTGAAVPVLMVIKADDQQHAVDPATFREKLARSLAEGSFGWWSCWIGPREELALVMGYLQPVTGKIDIDQYSDGNSPPSSSRQPQSRLHAPPLPSTDSPQPAGSNISPNIAFRTGCTDFVNILIRLQAEATADDLLLDLGGAAGDLRGPVTS